MDVATKPQDMSLTQMAVEDELSELESTRGSSPDLDQLKRRLPQANGDQDAW